jgi:hypothetical protein
VTDSTRKNAQARLLSGEPWPDICAKSKTLPGSCASHPLGLHDIGDADFVGIFEGGPDLLAGLDLLGHRNRGKAFSVVGIVGAAMRLEPYAGHFFGKRVRIFRHNDAAGESAAKSWGTALKAGGARVEIATPPEAYIDWNDVARIDRDSYGRNARQIEESLTWGGPKNA